MKNKRKFFDIFSVPLTQIPGGHIPVLVVNGQVSIYVLYYARELQRLGYANSTIVKKLMSIGRLWDFYLCTPEHMHNKDFLNAFCEARIHGTVQNDGSDTTSLYWTSPKYSTATRDFINVSDYLEFSSKNFSLVPFNTQERVYQGSLEYARQHERKKQYSLLYFINKNEEYHTKRKNNRKDKDKYDQSDENIQYKFFPPRKIPDLINTMTTIRDKMIVILLAFGGIRISELLHLYVFDIKRDNNGTAKVTIYNPVEGQHIWIDQNKKKHKDTRRNFLEQMYGRLPRNMLLPEDGLYIGWKGVAEEDSRKHISYVEWTVHEMGKAFYKLHKEYIKIRASYNADHPYYFVAESGATKGQPLRQSSLTAHLYNKFRKIGLDTLDDGVNPHGLRHYYGYYAANVLELDSDILQVMMRHKSKTSTDIYYHLTEETIRKKLEEGYKKISNNKELLSCLL